VVTANAPDAECNFRVLVVSTNKFARRPQQTRTSIIPWIETQCSHQQLYWRYSIACAMCKSPCPLWFHAIECTPPSVSSERRGGYFKGGEWYLGDASRWLLVADPSGTSTKSTVYRVRSSLVASPRRPGGLPFEVLSGIWDQGTPPPPTAPFTH
jgi:ferredoxin